MRVFEYLMKILQIMLGRRESQMNWHATAVLCILISVSNLALSLSELQSLSETKTKVDHMMHSIEATRNQRFSGSSTAAPLDKLFSMQRARTDELGEHITQMLAHARIHTEAVNKVQEEMAALEQQRKKSKNLQRQQKQI